ncbi:acyltransferase family protein [Maritalea myrionectae]|uniref:acyltransferase family protein n=1 Tax=Maritalea myrionectae TaxID=454601 RepID=UPI0003FE59B2|nr:acyltransferase [Maritalea myrionectae]
MTVSHTDNAIRAGAERDVTLDIFRAAAILLVILYHYTARLPATVFGAAEPLALPVVFGWVGVYFFFILSGYCIFYTLERAPTIWRFFAKRFSRIYPAFAAAAILLFALDQIVPLPLLPQFDFRPTQPNWTDLVGNLLFLGGIFEWVNGSFWSITVELQFYALIGFCAMAFKNSNRLVEFFHRLSVVLAIFWLLTFWAGLVFDPIWKVATGLRLVLIAPFLPFFALGVLGAQLAKGRWHFSNAFKLQMLLASLVVFSQAAGISPYLFGPRTLLPVIITFWLIVLFRSFAEGWRLPHIPLITPSLTQVGLVSYSWYLLHENLGYLLLRAMTPTLGYAISLPLTIVSTGIAAFLFSWAFEWRFRKGAEWFAEGILMFISRLLPKKIGEGMA